MRERNRGSQMFSTVSWQQFADVGEILIRFVADAFLRFLLIMPADKDLCAALEIGVGKDTKTGHI